MTRINESSKARARRSRRFLFAIEPSGHHRQPENRDRVVSKALQAYAAMASSADKGAVRDLSLIGVK